MAKISKVPDSASDQDEAELQLLIESNAITAAAPSLPVPSSAAVRSANLLNAARGTGSPRKELGAAQNVQAFSSKLRRQLVSAAISTTAPSLKISSSTRTNTQSSSNVPNGAKKAGKLKEPTILRRRVPAPKVERRGDVYEVPPSPEKTAAPARPRKVKKDTTSDGGVARVDGGTTMEPPTKAASSTVVVSSNTATDSSPPFPTLPSLQDPTETTAEVDIPPHLFSEENAHEAIIVPESAQKPDPNEPVLRKSSRVASQHPKGTVAKTKRKGTDEQQSDRPNKSPRREKPNNDKIVEPSSHRTRSVGGQVVIPTRRRSSRQMQVQHGELGTSASSKNLQEEASTKADRTPEDTEPRDGPRSDDGIEDETILHETEEDKKPVELIQFSPPDAESDDSEDEDNHLIGVRWMRKFAQSSARGGRPHTPQGSAIRDECKAVRALFYDDETVDAEKVAIALKGIHTQLRAIHSIDDVGEQAEVKADAYRYLFRALAVVFLDVHAWALSAYGDELCLETLQTLRPLVRDILSFKDTIRLWSVETGSRFPGDVMIRDVHKKFLNPLQRLKRLYTNQLSAHRSALELKKIRDEMQEKRRKKEEDEERNRKALELRKKRWEHWQRLHAVRLACEPDFRRSRHLRIRPIEAFEETDANGMPFERVAAFRDRVTPPRRAPLVEEKEWEDDELAVLIESLEKYAGPQVFETIFRKHCRVSGKLRAYNVAEITAQAAYICSGIMRRYQENGWGEAPGWVEMIPVLP